MDYVALSFVRSAADIEVARAYMRAQGKIKPIVAKIEKHEALAELDEIIAAVDAHHGRARRPRRGHPAGEGAHRPAAHHRKGQFRRQARHHRHADAQEHGRRPRPTRAEVTDVTNAVLEGNRTP